MSVAFIPAIVGGIITAVAGKKIAKKHKLLGSIMMVGGAMLAGGAISGAVSGGSTAVAATGEVAPVMGIGEGASIAEGAMSAAPTVATSTPFGMEISGNALATEAAAASSPASAGLLDVAASAPAASTASIASVAPSSTAPIATAAADGSVQVIGGQHYIAQNGYLQAVSPEMAAGAAGNAGSGNFLGSNMGMATMMVGGQAVTGYMAAKEEEKNRAAQEAQWNKTHEAGRFDVGLLDQATTQYIDNRNAGVKLPNQPQPAANNGLLDPRYV